MKFNNTHKSISFPLKRGWEEEREGTLFFEEREAGENDVLK